MLGPTVEMGGASAQVSDEYSVQFSRFGPFIDYYFDPHQGLHFLASAAMTSFSVSKGQSGDNLANAKGFALTAGIGYEAWIGEQWSMGALLRFAYADLSVDSEHHSVTAPALVATLTCH